MEPIHRSLIAIGAFSMGIAVILGALGAHALESVLSPDQLDSFKTGVRYQAWHSIALLFLGAGGKNFLLPKTLRILLILFTLGIIFFSFSIYLLSLREILGLSGIGSFLGPITPIGGTLLIAAWLYLGIKTLATKWSISTAKR
jgi:uncharacterized membrane protein YgdD (TMEM256/DUF423 family)